MSKGSPIVPIRIPDWLLALIDADIERSILNDQNPRDSRTSWILSAVQDVFLHRARAKLARHTRQARRRVKSGVGQPSAFDGALAGRNE